MIYGKVACVVAEAIIGVDRARTAIRAGKCEPRRGIDAARLNYPGIVDLQADSVAVHTAQRSFGERVGDRASGIGIGARGNQYCCGKSLDPIRGRPPGPWTCGWLSLLRLEAHASPRRAT